MGWRDWLAVVFGLTLALLIIMTGKAPGHHFYSVGCCDDEDCHPIASERVNHTQAGYLVDGRWLFGFKEVKVAPDGQFHLCDPFPEVKPRCLYVPPNST